jgi:hypothetical protein
MSMRAISYIAAILLAVKWQQMALLLGVVSSELIGAFEADAHIPEVLTG